MTTTGMKTYNSSHIKYKAIKVIAAKIGIKGKCQKSTN